MTNTKVFHSHNQFVRGKSHIEAKESFSSFTKRRLAKFNGLSVGTEQCSVPTPIYLHLKESQFSFNNRFNNIYAIMLNNLEISYALKFPPDHIFILIYFIDFLILPSLA